MGPGQLNVPWEFLVVGKENLKAQPEEELSSGKDSTLF